VLGYLRVHSVAWLRTNDSETADVSLQPITEHRHVRGATIHSPLARLTTHALRWQKSIKFGRYCWWWEQC